jgi:hypothetical protein
MKLGSTASLHNRVYLVLEASKSISDKIAWQIEVKVGSKPKLV